MQRTAATLAIAGLALSSCAGAPPRVDGAAPPLTAVASNLAQDLADAAGTRTHLGSMRVVVAELEPGDGPWDEEGWAVGSEQRLGALGSALRHELQLALAGRMNVLAGTADDLDPAAPFAPTHAVVGTIAPLGDDLEVVLRLVALDSRLIVAPARERLPIALGDLRADGFDLLPADLPPALPTVEQAGALAEAGPTMPDGVAAEVGTGEEVAWEGPAATRVKALRRLGHGEPTGP